MSRPPDAENVILGYLKDKIKKNPNLSGILDEEIEKILTTLIDNQFSNTATARKNLRSTIEKISNRIVGE